MKIKLGAIITDASGKVGGQIVSKNVSSHSFRNKSVSKIAHTSSQSAIRATTQYVMQSYKSLNTDAKSKWEVNAKLYTRQYFSGSTQNLSAFGLFQVINQNRVLSGLGLLTTPAPYHIASQAQGISVEASQTSIIVSSTFYNSNDVIALYATKNLSRGISKPNRYMRLLGYFDGADFESGIDVITEYVAKFGSISLDDRLFFGVKTISAISYFSNNVFVSNIEATIVENSGPVYGPELIPDPSVLTATDVGMSYSSGVWTFNNVPRFQLLWDPNILETGKQYKCEVEMFDYSSGNLRFVRPSSTGTFSSNGLQSFILDNPSNDDYGLSPTFNGANTFKLRNFSCREVISL